MGKTFKIRHPKPKKRKQTKFDEDFQEELSDFNWNLVEKLKRKNVSPIRAEKRSFFHGE
jgi:hypothetical protein